MASEQKIKNIGLALGGGVTFGAAHIGVLKALEETPLKVSCISGTSIGAYIAALYAFGISPTDIETEVEGIDWFDISSFSLLKLGLLANDKLGKRIEGMLGEVNIQDATIPLAIIATDIGSGQKSVLKDCSLSHAVMASSCLPGIFLPVEIDDMLLVDGGLVENVPISPLHGLGADKTVGVDLSADRSYQRPEDIVDVLVNSIDIAIDSATRVQTLDADLVISPKLRAYSRTDTGKISELIDEGYKACRTALNNSDLLPK